MFHSQAVLLLLVPCEAYNDSNNPGSNTRTLDTWGQYVDITRILDEFKIVQLCSSHVVSNRVCLYRVCLQLS